MYMIVRGRGIGTDSTRSKMPCESCAVQFSVFRRKRACTECDRYYCSGCLRRGGGAMCAPCRVLSTRPLSRANIAHLKVRDLQCFLQRQNVSTRGCVEKEELVSLCVSLVNNASYRRRGSRAGAGARTGAFSSFKGLTNNINDFINTAFDIRCTPQRGSPPPTHNCHNSSHAHTPPGNAGPAPPQRERFNPTPGGERDVRGAPPPPGSPPAPRGVPRAASAESARVDTADCFEIEDLDDAGWEFVTRPADPLPNDSEVLMSAAEAAATSHTRPAWSPGGIGPGPREARARPRDADVEPHEAEAGLARASSELELRRSESVATDTASLQDEPLMDHDDGTPKHITLEQMKQPSDLEALNVKQLKELLTRNRVEYRGCIERADLLNRAMMLWRDHTQYKDELDNLPIEECCKICMAAPLECVLLECGHIAACTACSKQLAECPICRQYVVRAVRVFRS